MIIFLRTYIVFGRIVYVQHFESRYFSWFSEKNEYSWGYEDVCKYILKHCGGEVVTFLSHFIVLGSF